MARVKAPADGGGKEIRVEHAMAEQRSIVSMLQELGIHDDMATRISARVASEHRATVQEALSTLGGDPDSLGHDGGTLSQFLGGMAYGTNSMLTTSLSTLTEDSGQREPLVASYDLEGIAQYIKDSQCSHVVVLCGSGIGFSAGLPNLHDESSPLMRRLKEQHNLPSADALFNKVFFQRNPEPFLEMAKELWPGKYTPTPAHFFIKLLHEKGILQRCYTQNIDSLETLAGLPKEKVVAAHGNFNHAHALVDDEGSDAVGERSSVISLDDPIPVDLEELKAALGEGKSAYEDLCRRKGGLVKPGVILRREPMPVSWDLRRQDLPKCDLLVVLGSSLTNRPFNSLLSAAPSTVPRLLVHTQPTGLVSDLRGGFEFQSAANWRDVWQESNCDSGCRALAAALGWDQELELLIQSKGDSAITLAPWVEQDRARA